MKKSFLCLSVVYSEVSCIYLITDSRSKVMLQILAVCEAKKKK
jgi:hypothetical protein